MPPSLDNDSGHIGASASSACIFESALSPHFQTGANTFVSFDVLHQRLPTRFPHLCNLCNHVTLVTGIRHSRHPPPNPRPFYDLPENVTTLTSKNPRSYRHCYDVTTCYDLEEGSHRNHPPVLSFSSSCSSLSSVLSPLTL